MSRRSESDQTPAVERDSGFTVVEVIVAFAIVVALVVAILPQLVVGIKSNDVARRASQSKSFAQSEMERIRNLPFHIAPAAGDYRDVFDTYFRNDVRPDAIDCGSATAWRTPTSAWKGYVPPTGARCGWEPAGAMYRYIRTEATNPELQGFVLVVDTQFLSDSTPPTVVTPPNGYDTTDAHAVLNSPPTSQAAVTVTVFPTGYRTAHPVSSSTQIDRRVVSQPRMRSSVDISAVNLGTATVDSIPLTLSAGLVNLTGSLTYSSNARAVLAATVTGASTGQQAGGASATLSAPPAATAPVVDAAPGSLDPTGCALACWGTTRLSSAGLTAGNGLPNVGSPTSPLQSILTGSGGEGLGLGSGAADASYEPALGLEPPLISLHDGTVRSGVASSCGVSETGDGVRIASSGWLRTTSSDDVANPLLTEACGTTRAAYLAVLPTTFAPDGVLRVSLPSASVRCAVSGPGHTPSTSLDYTAVIERWTPTGYVEAARVRPTSATDLLAAVPLTTPLGEHGTLADYIASWSTLPSSEVVRTTAPGSAAVSVPGLVNITTAPLRRDATNAPDPLSSVSVSVGVLSCNAEDAR